MNETIREYCQSGPERLRVDARAAVIRGVKILGLKSRNGRVYTEQALQQAAGLYEGAKVNVNHPRHDATAPREYQERLGVVRNVAFRRARGLYADLHYNPKHPIAEQLAWDAQHEPANVGLSHNVVAVTHRRGENTVVESITKVASVDLVADPATTAGLFEQTESGETSQIDDDVWPRICLSDLQAHRPDLVQRAIEEHARGERDALAEEVERLKSERSTLIRRQQIRQRLGLVRK